MSEVEVVAGVRNELRLSVINISRALALANNFFRVPVPANNFSRALAPANNFFGLQFWWLPWKMVVGSGTSSSGSGCRSLMIGLRTNFIKS